MENGQKDNRYARKGYRAIIYHNGEFVLSNKIYPKAPKQSCWSLAKPFVFPDTIGEVLSFSDLWLYFPNGMEANYFRLLLRLYYKGTISKFVYQPQAIPLGVYTDSGIERTYRPDYFIVVPSHINNKQKAVPVVPPCGVVELKRTFRRSRGGFSTRKKTDIVKNKYGIDIKYVTASALRRAGQREIPPKIYDWEERNF